MASSFTAYQTRKDGLKPYFSHLASMRQNPASRRLGVRVGRVLSETRPWEERCSQPFNRTEGCGAPAALPPSTARGAHQMHPTYQLLHILTVNRRSRPRTDLQRSSEATAGLLIEKQKKTLELPLIICVSQEKYQKRFGMTTILACTSKHRPPLSHSCRFLYYM